MNISTTELKTVFESLLRYLEEQGISEVSVPVDYYWEVPSSSRYDPLHRPVELTLGQVSDDWGELVKIASGQADPVGYAIVWLGEVLVAIGHNTAF